MRFNWANDLNENIEPFGGIVARSRGAVLDSDDVMFALSHLSVRSSKMVNELRFQFADPRSDGALARSEVRRRVHAREPGRADARSARRGQRRAAALHAAAAQEPALSGARHRELLHGAASVQGGLRFQLHRRDRADACRCTSADGISSAHSRGAGAAVRPAGGRDSGDRRRALGIPGRYVQGYGDSAAPYTYRTFRCSRRTTGASRRA